MLEKYCEKKKFVKFHREGKSNCTLTWKDSEVKWQNVHNHVCKRTNSTKRDFSIVGIPSTAVVNDAGEAAAAPIAASSTTATSSSTNPTAAAPVASSAAAASSSTPSDAGRVAVVPQVVKMQPWPPVASLPLKLQLLLQAPKSSTFAQSFRVSWGSQLGKGKNKVFKAVSMDESVELAAKAFKNDDRGFQSALTEVCALAAFNVHPRLLRLVDVAIIDNRVCLATEKYACTLRQLNQKRIVEESEQTHILECICEGLSHLHQAWICHNDLKLQNILLRGFEEPPMDKGPTLEHAQWMFNVRGRMSVCVADFGNAILGRSGQTPRPSQQRVSECGIDEVTLWYRAPEILLGLAQYSYPVDMWALGCIAAELKTRATLFPGQNEIDQARRIFSLLGTPPKKDMVRISGRPEPLHHHLPVFSPEPWPPPSLEGSRLAFIDFLRRSIEVDPTKRISASDSLTHEFLLPRRMRTFISVLPAGQGPASVQTAELEDLDPLLLSWLQADPFLAIFVKQGIDNKFQGGPQPGLKAESSWYARDKCPTTPTINKQDASQPCPGHRLA